jgi:integrase
MECTLQSPSYLVRNVHSYCFRLIVPKDLKKFVGKTELRYTLRTGYIGVAKRKSRFLAAQIQAIFQMLRKGLFDMGKLSADQVQQLVGKYIKKSVEDMDEVFNQPEAQKPYLDLEGFHNYIGELPSIKDDLVASLNLGDFSMLEKSIGQFLRANGIDEVDKDSPEYRKLSIEVHKAETKLIPIQRQHMLCDFSYREQLPTIFPGVFAKEEDRPPERREDEPRKDIPKKVEISQVFKEYWKEKEPELKPRSVPEFQRALSHFFAFAGHNTDIAEINGGVLREYKKKLQNEKSRGGKPRSPKTINDKYLSLVSGFFTYAKHHSYIDKNPVDGLISKERRGKRPDEERDPFSTDDLQKIFCESPEYREDQMQHPHQFWVPLIGLFTGMRIEEVCQLYVSDFKQVDGVWCFDINEDKPDKSVKSSERRIVPLHSFLVQDLNFVGYVQSLPNQDGRIFPELTRIAKRYSHHASPWFSKFKDRCGVLAQAGNKTFHSFRHTVTDQLYKKEVPDRVISMLVGHAIKGETGGRYGKRYEPKLQYETSVSKLDYGIDLSHLKNSKWVVR